MLFVCLVWPWLGESVYPLYRCPQTGSIVCPEPSLNHGGKRHLLKPTVKGPLVQGITQFRATMNEISCHLKLCFDVDLRRVASMQLHVRSFVLEEANDNRIAACVSCGFQLSVLLLNCGKNWNTSNHHKQHFGEAPIVPFWDQQRCVIFFLGYFC